MFWRWISGSFNVFLLSSSGFVQVPLCLHQELLLLILHLCGQFLFVGYFAGDLPSLSWWTSKSGCFLPDQHSSLCFLRQHRFSCPAGSPEFSPSSDLESLRSTFLPFQPGLLWAFPLSSTSSLQWIISSEPIESSHSEWLLHKLAVSHTIRAGNDLIISHELWKLAVDKLKLTPMNSFSICFHP